MSSFGDVAVSYMRLSFRFFGSGQFKHFLIYALLCNVPYWFACKSLGIILRSWICLDYILLGVIALFLPSILSAFLLVIAIPLDLVEAICKTNDLTPSEVTRNGYYFLSFSSTRIVWIAITGIIILATALWAAILHTNRDRLFRRAKTALCLILFAVLCTSIDAVTSSAGTGRAPNVLRAFKGADTLATSYFTHPRVVRSPAWWWIRSQLYSVNLHRAGQIAREHILPMRSASSAGIASLQYISRRSGQQPNFVLIIVESWGMPLDSTLRNALVAPYYRADLLARYSVLQGSVPFGGGTVGGEARELCGSTIGVSIIDASASDLKNCLPAQLETAGYDNIALHGMNRNWFSRRTWYPLAGFSEMHFHTDFQAQHLPDCVGAFKGTCDASIADWIGRRMKRTQASPYFVYWVTLNSHLPVSCSISTSVEKSTALCGWLQLEVNVHEAIYQLAMQHETRPTVFVVVGDHAPPFTSVDLREDFSDKVVPYVVLTPRL
jgi:hypothetical protein